MFYFYKLKQLKEVLYDGLEKMPRKDGKTHCIMIIVKTNIMIPGLQQNSQPFPFTVTGGKTPCCTSQLNSNIFSNWRGMCHMLWVKTH